MKYNTSRSQMSMPEYGRNIQAMIAHLATMEDRKKRLRCAEYIIDLMALFNPHCKAMEDYRHKLWDHLHFMADFDLDIDVPYPPPTKEELAKKPEPLPYPAKTTHHRHLGHNINILVERAVNV